MLPRTVKAGFYFVAGPLMKANGALHRSLRTPRAGVIRAHLGPGQKNYLPQWVNVDANMFTARCDVWADLRNKLPFRDGSVDAFYSHHVVEHLPNMERHFADMFRCLKPGGVIRIGGPNGDVAVRKFLEGDHSWFGDFPDKRSSIGGRLDNFLLCRGEHVALLTLSYLQEIATRVGFRDIEPRQVCTETAYPDRFDPAVLALEEEQTPEAAHTLIIEARKPLDA